MTDKKKIGFFGGSFDPIHFGHLNLALSLQELSSLDEVWFSPAYISPHKQEQPPAKAKHREKMVKLGIEEIPSFKLFDRELKQKNPSYTIDTIERFLEEETSSQFYLIIGEDTLPGLPNWKNIEKLVDLIPFLIATRSTKESPPLPSSSKLQTAIHKGQKRTPIMEISATEIRTRLKKQLYCGHLLPQKVLDYIYENALYL